MVAELTPIPHWINRSANKMEKSIRFVTVRVIDKQPPPLSLPSPLGIIAASIDISGDQKSAQPHGVHMPQTKYALVTR